MVKNRIKELRIEASLKGIELAKIIGVSSPTISDWENNKKQPRLDKAEKLASYFHVSIPYLLGLSTEELAEENMSLKGVVDNGMIVTTDSSTIEYLEKMYQLRGFTVHKIKTESEHFEQTVAGLKPFETRLNDRNYKVGDICIQCECKDNDYTGRYLIGRIIYMNNFKLQEGYITFTFKQF